MDEDASHKISQQTRITQTNMTDGQTGIQPTGDNKRFTNNDDDNNSRIRKRTTTTCNTKSPTPTTIITKTTRATTKNRNNNGIHFLSFFLFFYSFSFFLSFILSFFLSFFFFFFSIFFFSVILLFFSFSSLQVPLWGTNDVYYWVKDVLNLPEYATKFKECHVDGDLLLRITEESMVRLQI